MTAEEADALVEKWQRENRLYFDRWLHPKAKQSLVERLVAATAAPEPKRPRRDVVRVESPKAE